MRSEKPADLLKLTQALAASAEGMTLDEMAEFSKVGRRTIERRRDALEAVFGPLDRIEEGRQVRFRMNGRGLGSFAHAPTSEELAELENAIRACEAASDEGRAENLRSLLLKIRASLRSAERRRLDTDIEAQLRAEAFARQVGPRPYADVLDAWRTSCPRLPVWEEANDRGFVARAHAPGTVQLVLVTESGARHLRACRGQALRSS